MAKLGDRLSTLDLKFEIHSSICASMSSSEGPVRRVVLSTCCTKYFQNSGDIYCTGSRVFVCWLCRRFFPSSSPWSKRRARRSRDRKLKRGYRRSEILHYRRYQDGRFRVLQTTSVYQVTRQDSGSRRANRSRNVSGEGCCSVSAVSLQTYFIRLNLNQMLVR